MDQEINNVLVWYNNSLNKLTSIRNYYYNLINRMGVRHNIKIYYKNYITTWYNYERSKLTKRKENMIREINTKYKDMNKKALLIGINYKNTTAELRGCVNDVTDLREMLISKYNYSYSNILTLTDSQATKQNIMSRLTQLLQSCKGGETLFFSFSGHGYYWNDIYKKDEIDGKDELIVTIDNHAIVDDELKYVIDTYLKENVTLVALFDNCHSGTILDLPYQYFKGDQDMIHNALSKDTKGTVICLSGCRDDQVSMDAYLKGNFNGAMTFNFIEMLKENDKITWKSGVEGIRNKLKAGNFNQVPQITCGKQMDLNSVVIKL
jgi:metacaspase-1